MPSMWQSLLAFFRSPREPYVPSPAPFLKIDVEALRAQLQPAQKGEAYGSQELPATDATVPDSRENEISRFCQDELDRSHVQITQGIDTHLSSIRQLSGVSAGAEISQLKDTALSELQSVAQRVGNTLEVGRHHADQLTQAFRRFREEHRRESLPDLSRGGLLSIAVIIMMVAVESALNGNMFAQGNDFGLLGGLLQAGMFSVANVGAGALAGVFVLPQLFHVARWRKTVGAIGLVTAIALSITLNMGIAHFRDAMVRGASDQEAAASAMQGLLSHPLALADLMSWLLFCLGLVFFWIACYDGFQIRDHYPGYAAEYRRMLAAKETYAQAVAEVHRSMASVRDGYSRRIADVARQRDIYAHHLTSLYDRIARLTNSYDRHCQDVCALNRRLVEEYRDANRRRRTSEAPAYFSTIVEVVAQPVPAYTSPGATSDVADAAADAVRALTEAHDNEIRRLITVAQLGITSSANG